MKNKFWYSTPSALSLEDWEEWRQEIEKNYPFQYWIRDTLPHWYRVHIAMPLRDLYWFIYRLIKPCHQDIRKVIPRQWADIASLIVDVNFAMLTSFKKEVDESFVEWNASPEHRKFGLIHQFIGSKWVVPHVRHSAMHCIHRIPCQTL